jgi:hypothetical protein
MPENDLATISSTLGAAERYSVSMVILLGLC